MISEPAIAINLCFEIAKYHNCTAGSVLVQHLLNLSLCMQEYGFEFDTSYGNNYQIHFSNNQFINVILGGTLDLH